MDQEILEKYKKAGEISKKAKARARELIKPGASILKIVEDIEALVKKENAGLAFPINLSLNEVSAHFTPDSNTELKISEHDLVKFDVGVHVDGYIADTAITMSMDKSEEQLKLIEAAEAGLDKAISIIKPGVKVKDIGEIVEKEIKDRGFVPISNLTGHGLDEYSLHAGLVIPNVKNDNNFELKEDQVIALEPFSTNGAGFVADSNEVHIYEFLMEKPTRNQEARKILKMAQTDFNNLPFAKRWLEKDFSKLRLALALKELTNSKALHSYPVLKEKEAGLVAQAEHTVIVQDEPVITTI